MQRASLCTSVSAQCSVDVAEPCTELGVPAHRHTPPGPRLAEAQQIATIRAVVQAHLSRGQAAEAEACLLQMAPRPPIDICNMILRHWTTARNAERAHGWLAQLRTRGIALDSASYEAVISMHCSLWDLQAAEQAMNAMLAQGLAPTRRLLSELAGAYTSVGDLTAASSITRRMRGQSDALLHTAPDVQPTEPGRASTRSDDPVGVTTSLSSLLSRQMGEVPSPRALYERAERQFESLRRMGILLDTTTIETNVGQLLQRNADDDLVYRLVSSALPYMNTRNPADFQRIFRKIRAARRGTLASRLLALLLPTDRADAVQDCPDVCAEVLGASCHTDMQEAQRFFERLLEAGVRPTGSMYDSLLFGWARRGNYAHVRETMQHMAASGVKTDTLTLNALLRMALTQEPWNAARIFADLRSMHRDFVPNALTYELLIRAAAVVRSTQQAEAFFQQMRQAGVRPRSHTYTVLADAYVRADRPAEAERILERMRATNDRPSPECLLTLMSGFAKRGDTAGMQRTLMRLAECTPGPGQLALLTTEQWLRAIGQAKPAVVGLLYRALADHSPEALSAVSSAMIRSLAALGRVFEAERWLARMSSSGAPLNARLFEWLSLGYAQTNSRESAEWTLERCERAMLVPTRCHFEIVLRAFSQVGDYTGCTRVYKRMIAAGIEPSGLACARLVVSHVNAGRLGQAGAYLQSLVATGMHYVEPYNALLSGYLHAGQTEEAERLLKQLRDDGVPPSGVTYNIRIVHALRTKQWDPAKALFHEAQSCGIALNATSFAMYIGSAEDNVALGEWFHQQMRRSGTLSHGRVYAALARMYTLAGRVTEACRMLDSAKADRTAPTTSLYNFVINACLLAGQKERAAALLDEMVREHVPMDRSTAMLRRGRAILRPSVARTEPSSVPAAGTHGQAAP